MKQAQLDKEEEREVRRALRSANFWSLMCRVGIHVRNNLLVSYEGRRVHVHTCSCGRKKCCGLGLMARL